MASINDVNDVNDVVDYIITKAKIEDDNLSLTHLKLQKILYYIQAWSLGILGKEMFNENFQAWVHGPVCRAVYDRFSDKTMYSEIRLEDRLGDDKNNFNMSEEDTKFIDYILENYLGFSGSELEDMTHNEKPWIDARKNLSKYSRSESKISIDLMKEYYGKRWKEINE